MTLNINEVAFNLLRLIKKIQNHPRNTPLSLTPMEVRIISTAKKEILAYVKAKNIRQFSILSKEGERKIFDFIDDPESIQFNEYQTPNKIGILLGKADLPNKKGSAALFFQLRGDSGCSFWSHVTNVNELEEAKDFYSAHNPDEILANAAQIYLDKFKNLSFDITNENDVNDLIANKNYHLFLLLVTNNFVNDSAILEGLALSKKTQLVKYIESYPDDKVRKSYLEQLLNPTTQLGQFLRAQRGWFKPKPTRGNFKVAIKAYKEFFPENEFERVLNAILAGKPLPLKLASAVVYETPYFLSNAEIIAPPPYEPPPYLPSYAPQLPSYAPPPYDPLAYIEPTPPSIIPIAPPWDALDSHPYLAIGLEEEKIAKEVEKTIVAPPLNHHEINKHLSQMMEEEKKETVASCLIDDNTEVEKFNRNSQQTNVLMPRNEITSSTSAVVSKNELLNQLESINAPVTLFTPDKKPKEDKSPKPERRISLTQ